MELFCYPNFDRHNFSQKSSCCLVIKFVFIGYYLNLKIMNDHVCLGGLYWPNQSHFLNVSYPELEEKNLSAKKERFSGKDSEYFEKKYLKYLESDKGIKAVTVCFTDMEGKLQLLDYDKKFLIGAHDNLTFDGSSIKGFTAQSESDLRLRVDWSSFRWLPADIFGSGKVLVFGHVCDKDGSLYDGDYRSTLMKLSDSLKKTEGIVVNVAPEVEGFLFKGIDAEQNFDERRGFELATMSGYFNCLPQDILRLFIDKFAEAQRALGFENEKDHPEVAPAQFELNFKYSTALDMADQIQIYKLLARQIAKTMGLTASFLPKPVAGLNGSGMHTNISLSKNDINLFYSSSDKAKLSEAAYNFAAGVLYYANDICLVMNSSVNSYRRLDPHFEAPNEIKMSAVDRGSMVRLPIGNEKSARLEIRTVAPDANPYMTIYAILKAGLKGMNAYGDELKKYQAVFLGPIKKLPGEIHTAIENFDRSEFMEEIMGEKNHRKFLEIKRIVADRCPKALGRKLKAEEVLYHHEVTNQMLWADF